MKLFYTAASKAILSKAPLQKYLCQEHRITNTDVSTFLQFLGIINIQKALNFDTESPIGDIQNSKNGMSQTVIDYSHLFITYMNQLK